MSTGSMELMSHLPSKCSEKVGRTIVCLVEYNGWSWRHHCTMDVGCECTVEPSVERLLA